MDTTLPGTSPLTWTDDPAWRMLDGLHAWLDRAVVEAAAARPRPGPGSVEHLADLVGCRAADRVPSRLELVGHPDEAEPGLVGRGERYRILQVRWPVFGEVWGEGLLCQPVDPLAAVIAIPHCEVTPEQLCGLAPGLPPAAQTARRLAQEGCRVLVPTLLDRGTGGVRNPFGAESTLPRREFIYRAAFVVGRTMPGLELDLLLAAAEALGDDLPRGLCGTGEGGLLALYGQALDPGCAAAWTSGYFGPREALWTEPLDRNLFGLLNEFGDAEIAALAGPHPLIVQLGPSPEQVLAGYDNTQHHPTPGAIVTPPAEAVTAEADRARGLGATALTLAAGPEAAFTAFCSALSFTPVAPEGAPEVVRTVDAAARQQRVFDGWLALTQRLVATAESRRQAFWAGLDRSSPEALVRTAEPYRERFWNDLLGPVPPADVPLNPRTRQRFADEHVTVWEVALDVYDTVFAWGLLVLPNDLAPGERRPVVVCQHGLEGRPESGALPADSPAYRAWGYRLARRGFVVFCPQNPYLGFDHFRTLQRKANPLKKSLFSFIVRQHERIVEWLGQQPFVDPARIGFYGISYGGKTAMRVPVMVPGYCLSICSGDFNEWLRKNAQVDYPHGYLFTSEYEMPEFAIGETFNYAEMSWLQFPRPLMVERGHGDGCGTDGWVAYEWARAWAVYHRLGYGDRAEIEWFDGGHEIHGEGTFAFLHRWLDWPAPQ